MLFHIELLCQCTYCFDAWFQCNLLYFSVAHCVNIIKYILGYNYKIHEFWVLLYFAAIFSYLGAIKFYCSMMLYMYLLIAHHYAWYCLICVCLVYWLAPWLVDCIILVWLALLFIRASMASFLLPSASAHVLLPSLYISVFFLCNSNWLSVYSWYASVYILLMRFYLLKLLHWLVGSTSAILSVLLLAFA